MFFTTIDLNSSAFLQCLLSALKREERQQIVKLPENQRDLIDSLSCQLGVPIQDLLKKLCKLRNWQPAPRRSSKELKFLKYHENEGFLLVADEEQQLCYTSNPFNEEFLKLLAECEMTQAPTSWVLTSFSNISMLSKILADNVPCHTRLQGDDLKVREANKQGRKLLKGKPVLSKATKSSKQSRPEAIEKVAPNQQEQAEPTVEVGEGIKKGKPKLLLLDDDENFIKVLSLFLTRAGYETVITYRTVEAQAQLSQSQVDRPFVALISDVHLKVKGIEGLNDETATEFVARLRKDPVFQHFPILMLSSDSSTSNRVNCLAEGADMILPKYVDPRLILAYLKRFIDKEKYYLHPKSMDNC